MSVFARERLLQLIAQREALETEAFALSEDLNSPGLNGEKPAGIKSPLVDSEGYPRGDIDLVLVRQKRNRLAILNTDHKSIMVDIEKELQQVHADLSYSQISETSKSGAIDQNLLSTKVVKSTSLVPFAKLDEILDGSPAKEANIEDGDLLLSFGHVSASADQDAMSLIPGVVRDNLNEPIILTVIKAKTGKIETMTIIPKAWGGRGLLGCHLSPIKPV